MSNIRSERGGLRRRGFFGLGRKALAGKGWRRWRKLPIEPLEHRNLLAGLDVVGYQIELEYPAGDIPITQMQQDLIEEAAVVYEAIVSDTLPARADVDFDLTIQVEAATLSSGAVAETRIITSPDATLLPTVSGIQFNTIDLTTNYDDASLADPTRAERFKRITMHEMAHAMGFGVLWSQLGLAETVDGMPQFNGSSATAEYNDLYGATPDTPANSVPVEPEGASGTQFLHWRESVLGTELLTGWAAPGDSQLSAITIASLEDIGYPLSDTPTALGEAFVPRTIEGTVYHDIESNGTRDLRDPGFEGWTVYLDDIIPNGQLDDGETRTTTEADGSYFFSGLAASPHLVRQEIQAPWTQTEPTASAGVSVDLTSSLLVSDIDFGNDDGAMRVWIDDVEAFEGDASLTFTIGLSRAVGTGEPLVIHYTPTGGTALSVYAGENDDADPANDWSVTFTGTELTQEIVIALAGTDALDDTQVEASKTLVVNLDLRDDPSAAILWDADAVGTLQDDDVPNLSIGNVASVDEGQDAVFVVTIDRVNGTDLNVPREDISTVDFETIDDTAKVLDGDYADHSGTLSFDPLLDDTLEITVPVHADTVFEGGENATDPEVFFVSLLYPIGCNLVTTLGSATIRDLSDDPTVDLVGSTSTTEGGELIFSLTLSEVSDEDVTVNYTVTDVTTSPADHAGISGSITIAPGETTGEIRFATTDDARNENDETLTVTLGTPAGAVLGTVTEATGTIIDDGDPAPTVSITPAESTEPADMTFHVTLSTESGKEITVDYALGDVADTATLGEDYANASGTLTFAPGETDKTFTVLVLDDMLSEGDETFTATLSNPINTTLADAVAEGTIHDDEGPEVSIIDVATVFEGDTLVFTVTLAAASTSTATVPYSVTDVTTDSGDYTFPGSSVTFAPGETSQEIRIVTIDDGWNEDDETLTVTLGTPTGAVLGTASEATGTIQDDGDPAPTVSITPAESTEPGDMTFQVTLSSASGKEIAVDYALADGTAVADDPGTPTVDGDYSSTSGTLTFAPGETSKTFSVVVFDDALVEGDEAFTATLTNPTNATLADATAEGTIHDDEGPSVLIADATPVHEGNTLVFTVTLASAGTSTATVPYSVADVTTDSGDYTLPGSAVTFAPGETSQEIRIVTIDDGWNEDDETLTVTLGTPTGAVLGTVTEATGTIQDDGDPAPTVSIAPAESVEPGDMTFQVTLSSASGKEIAVDYALANGTAVADDPGTPTVDGDYSSTSGTLTFAPGETSKTFSVVVFDDALVEGDEAFTATLSNPINTTLADATAEGTIHDDEGPTVSIGGDTSIFEGGTLVFTVTLASAGTSIATVPYSVTDVTTDWMDYYMPAGSVTFAVGETTQEIRIDTYDDAWSEDNETLTVTLGTPSGAVLGTVTEATGTILDDGDPAPTVSITPAESTEPGDMTFLVTLSADSGKEITVDYALTDDTAVADDPGTPTVDGDYAGMSGTLTFAPGETSKTFTVVVFDDADVEGDETFTATLSNPINATLADAVVDGTIHDDEGPSVSIADATSVYEGDTLVFTVTLASASTSTATVPYSVADVTTDGNDYSVPGGAVTFAPGETTQEIRIVTTDDGLNEDDETLTVTLETPTGAALGTVIEANGTILHDGDPAPTISIVDSTSVEPGFMTFRVVLSGQSGKEISVDYALTPDTAVADDPGTPELDGDYVDTSGTLTFAPNVTQQTFTVLVLDDTLDEDAETYSVSLSNATNATLADPTATGTIIDNDPSPVITLAADGPVVEGGMVTVTVTLSESSLREIEVAYATAIDTADGDDYELIDGTLTFAPGETEKTFTITTIDDVIDEADEEVFSVSLSGPVNATLGTPVAVDVTVTDNDAPPTVSISDTSADEEDDDTATMTFTVTLSAASEQVVEVDFATTDDTAEAGVDYVAASGSVTFAPGETETSVVVTLLGNLDEQPDRELVVDLTNATHATLDDAQAVGTILDDDTYIAAIEVPQAIPDNGVLEATLVIDEVITAEDIDVAIDISHSQLDDLEVTLISPNGTEVPLFAYLPSDSGGTVGMILDDSANAWPDLGDAPYTGRFRPNQPLSVLAGTLAQGTWTLRISDVSAGDTGQLDNWGLHIQTDPSANTTPNLGNLERVELVGLDPSSGDLEYEISVAHDGYLTVLTETTDGPDSVTVKILDATGRKLVSGNERLDLVDAVAGATYRLVVQGTTDDVDVSLFNVLGKTGTDVTIHPSIVADDVVIDLTSNVFVSINGLEYTFDLAEVTTIGFAGDAANDTATVIGSTGADTAELVAGAALLTTPSVEVTVQGMRSISLSGGAGDDTLSVFDSAGDDVVALGPQTASMTDAAGQTHEGLADGFETIQAYSNQGGEDQLVLTDSALDDELWIESGAVNMVGDEFALWTQGFDQVEVSADLGGNDTATLIGSDGDDVLSTIAEQVTYTVNGQSVYTVSRFENLVVEAGEGGTDTARLIGSTRDDYMTTTPESIQLNLGGYVIQADGFAAVDVFGGGGIDRAVMTDSVGNDRVRAGIDWTRLKGTDYRQSVNDFYKVTVKATAGGRDVAKLIGSDGNDTFVTRPNVGRMFSQAYRLRTEKFERVVGRGAGSGNDVARLRGSGSNDRLIAHSRNVDFTGDIFDVRARAFDLVIAEASLGNDDRAELLDAIGADHLLINGSQTPDRAQVTFANGMVVQAQHFDWVLASGSRGGGNTKSVRGTSRLAYDLVDQW